MSNKRICCLINASLSEMLMEGLSAFESEFGRLFSLRLHFSHDIEEERVPSAEVRRDLIEADLVLLDLRGSGRATSLAASALRGEKNTVALLVGGSPEIMSLLRMGSFSLKDIVKRQRGKPPEGTSNTQRVQNVMRWVERAGDIMPVGVLRHARNWNKVIRYWSHGGPENVKNLLTFLCREYLRYKLPTPPEPREYPEFGIYDLLAKAFYHTLDEYRSAVGYDPAKPTVGLFFYGGMHFAQSVVAAEALARRLAQDHNLIPVFSNSGHNLAAIETFFLDRDQARVDAMVYFQWFQLTTFAETREKTTLEILKSLNVPVFAGTPLYGRERKEWLKEVQGLSPVEIMTTVIMPELDGMIEPVPSLALEERIHPATGHLVKSATALEDQADRIAERIRRRVGLRYKRNEEKRVAYIIYNNPPGEDNIGNAAYLDVFASVRKALEKMKARGYQVEDLPSNKEICQKLIDTGAVNNARWVPQNKSLAAAKTIPAERYEKMWQALPQPKEVVEAWGEAPGEIMAGEGRVIMPGFEAGNVFLGLQPARGIHSDPEKITHDKTLPPHHQYVAFYKWLEEDWKADAIIHVGTHGTLEFLKGKEVGMSPFCYPAILIGSVPHLYIYHVVNPSEAMLAKRRSLGTIVNYNSPPLTVSGLYEQYADLEVLIGEYLEAEVSHPLKLPRIEAKIMETAKALNLMKETVPEIQEELATMKRSLIPKGLHILDEDLSPEELAETVTYFLRYDRGEVPSLHRVLGQQQGYNYDGLLDAPGEQVNGKTGAAILEEIEAEAHRLIAQSIQEKKPAADGALKKSLEWALAVTDKIRAGLEIPALLNGLEGTYTMPGIGGEPVRDPETLPTGRNTFQFDPRLVPSEAAYERGKQIAENTLEHYHKLNGRYPESVGIILWAFETAKTRGETVGQIFGYLGMKPVRRNPWKTELEIIPISELGRPRVDVTVQICGFFRDMFINVVHLINKAFEMVSKLDETPEQNFVKPHTEAVAAKLMEQVEREKAWRIASARVFGPRAGEYGTRVTHLIETAAWKTEEDIVSTFMASMNHLYAENIHGVRFAEVYEQRLKSVEVVSQIRDTHDYEIADLDHYYEYFGGLSRVVESVRGQAPVQLITDTTKERVKTETVTESLERGIRTRLLNPEWINAMLEHDVHGAQQISDRVEYLIGFAATTHAVRDWVFSSVAERYLFDEEMRKRLKENNPYATEEILKRLLEAYERQYWDASEEEVERLKEIYLELEGDIEETL